MTLEVRPIKSSRLLMNEQATLATMLSLKAHVNWPSFSVQLFVVVEVT